MASGAVPWFRLSGRRHLPVLRQSTIAECGLTCVAMIAAYFGSGADLASLRRHTGASIAGMNLASLLRVGKSLHLSGRAVRCRLSELGYLKKPCILHWEFEHFVVLKKVTGTHLHVHDPAVGSTKISFEDADAKFTGVAVEFTPTTGFQKRKPARKLSLVDLVTFDPGLTRTVSVAMVLAVISELLLLTSPFYLQTVIDQVLMRGDSLLLNTLVLGFSILTVFQLLASAMRQLTFQFVSQATAFSLSSRVLHHLLRLPVSWFRSRKTGDIQQRMQSLGKIQAFITRSAPALLLDCVFLLIVVMLMLAYAPSLTFVVAMVAAVFVLWRIAVFPLMLEQSNRLILAEAATQTHLLESLRSMQSIKMCAGEVSRATGWQNLLVFRINTQIRAGNLSVADSTIRQGLFQGLHIGIVFLLASQVQDGAMSVGTLSAFAAYTGMFVARAGGIVNRVFEYRLLQVPLNRLADIVFNAAERCDHESGPQGNLLGNVQASGISFSYPGAKSAVLSDVSLSVTRGELVAIQGCSGSGKSTLLRLLAGIERVSPGGLLFDGKPADDWPLADLRRSIATVFSDDVLMSGTIANNIALFDPEPDRERVRRVADLAAVDEVIDALPMGYETPIGDLGSALSTGQVQRVLFARALYRKPSVLLLDEFTSGLDAVTERRVLRALQRLPATRIVVTHSTNVLGAADRVYHLRKGQLSLSSEGVVSPDKPAVCPTAGSDHAARSGD